MLTNQSLNSASPICSLSLTNHCFERVSRIVTCSIVSCRAFCIYPNKLISTIICTRSHINQYLHPFNFFHTNLHNIFIKHNSSFSAPIRFCVSFLQRLRKVLDMATKVYERTLEETPTWAVAVVCFVLLVVSIGIEHLIHGIGKVS